MFSGCRPEIETSQQRDNDRRFAFNGRFFGDAHLKNVSFQPLYLHVKVDDALLMNELDSLADLSHENGAGPFRQDEIVVDDPLEQFAAFDPVFTQIIKM